MQTPTTTSRAIRGAELVGSELTVLFTSGGRATYLDVDARVYCALLSAGSPGRYYGSMIRGCYQTKKGTP